MLKKVLCWLMLPLCAVGVLASCGKAKTAEQTRLLFEEVKSEFDKNGHYFKSDSKEMYIKYDGELSKIEDNAMGLSYSGVVTGDKITLTIPADFSSSESMYFRYYFLKNLQQSILTQLTSYYNKWEASFYQNIKLVDVEQAELDEYYASLETLRDDMRTFEQSRSKVQADVDVMTFSGAVRSNLTEYSFEFNKLIESYANFVSKFADIQSKYLFSKAPESDNSEYLNRLMDEFYLNMSQALYFKLVKAFSRTGECDFSKMTELFSASGNNRTLSTELYANQGEKSYYTFLNILNKKGDFTTTAFTGNVANKNTEIEEMLYARNAFLQKFGIYKQVYDKVDYYAYNQARIENSKDNTKLNDYKDTLNDVEQANIRLIESFESTILSEYCDAYLNLVK